mmetsp:Transcript_14015/g.18269  ORF Transcript_14015/g.18269 Transcript_14015/m.18269 type:complete len:315 (-) Transcript_14015:10-954(-)
MTMHSIEESFGEGCSLYEVLGCKKDADKAQLRKSYYRTALKVHPDKNPNNAEAAKSFQAVSLAYQILQDPDLREDYDESGVIPHNDALAAAGDDEDDKECSGVSTWMNYFDQIFGKVTLSKIDNFAAKYKCSDEEKRDVLKEFKKRKGNLEKMLEFVMLSEPRDAVRWVDDFLIPAMEAGNAESSYKEAMEKSLKKLKKQIEKENAEEANPASDVDDETETEEEEDADAKETTTKKVKAKKKSTAPKKPKGKKENNSMDDLIAQIQNKNKRGSNVLANLGARYGVTTGDDVDPLSDADFAKTQAKLQAKRRKKR